MKMRKACVCAAALAVGAWALGTPPAASTLKTVVCASVNEARAASLGSEYLRLDKKGEAELAFDVPSGKLRFKAVDARIIVDWNGDGKFDEQDGTVSGEGAKVEIPVTFGGKPFPYPLWVAPDEAVSGQRPTYVFLAGLVYLETQVLSKKVRVIDDTLNGRFGDMADPAGNARGDQFWIGSEKNIQPVTQCVIFEDSFLKGRLLELRVDTEAGVLWYCLYTGPMATLRIECKEGWKLQAGLRQREYVFVTDAESGKACTLVPGAYVLEWVSAALGVKKDEDGEDSRGDTELWGQGKANANVQINEGENRLVLGPPFTLEFTALRWTVDPADVEITGVTVAGAGIDRYRADNYGFGGQSTLACSMRSGATIEKVSTLEYG